MRLLAPLLLALGCSDSSSQCRASTELHESHCPNGEATRCYFLVKPIDGF